MKTCKECNGELIRLRHLIRDEAKYKCKVCNKITKENTRFKKKKT